MPYIYTPSAAENIGLSDLAVRTACYSARAMLDEGGMPIMNFSGRHH